MNYQYILKFDISKNFIQEVKKGSFKHMASLRIIDLSFNKLVDYK